MNQMTHIEHTKNAMLSCIEACSHCHQVCLQTGMNHGLETGGKHVEANHFRLIMSCAEICQTSANFQLSGSAFHRRLCLVCAEVCEACSAGCEKVGDMDECAEACRECAVSCRQMAGVQH